ncbi:hypothetical protein I5677_06605 [Mobilitalea sibirica]|uniref:Uncharacterized protein n=2 Tax=Mobilitalea sibirica TaxID=1462919 RepID=A0A8J7L2G5_9FIRM|nr:hypothetical protein [Mobilitalea sibirica]
MTSFKIEKISDENVFVTISKQTADGKFISNYYYTANIMFAENIPEVIMVKYNLI